MNTETKLLVGLTVYILYLSEKHLPIKNIFITN